ARARVKLGARELAAAAITVALVGTLAWRAVTALPTEVEREQRQICLPVEPAPGWEARPALPFTLRDYQGHEISLSRYRGSVVFLNFWATWCPPCVDEMQSLERLAAALGGRKDFALVAVSEDKSWDDIRTFFRQGSRMTVLMDDDWKVA